MTEKEVYKVVKDIKDLKVQGNTNIAKTVAKTVLDFVTHSQPSDLNELVLKTKQYAHDLSTARQNEPLALNAVAFILKDIEKCETRQQLRVKIIDKTENFFKYLDESYEIIRVNAINQLKGYNVFFTHCHSALSRDILIRIAELNSDVEIINDETRPLYQGRITATKLSQADIKVLHTIDSAVASVFLDPRYKKPEAVLVGCDGITLDGDLINKVGTYNIALAAKEAGVPFFVATQLMKFDLRSSPANKFKLEIEQRNKNEVWEDRPKHVDILNPAFDLVPGKYITGGYITEKGLIKPEEIKNYFGSL